MSSDSPNFDSVDTRYDTPAPELDDHRHHVGSLPRSDIDRRGTFRKPSTDRPALLQANEVLRGEGTVSRDFEHAIVDDNTHEMEGLQPDARQGSLTPMGARRMHRPSRNQERVNVSRDSSSTRSSSPPNSVDAFADPRRRERANTIDSHVPSIGPVERVRSVSGGSNGRRPTVSGGSIIRTDRQLADETEEDVCFPTMEEPGKTYKIDYEELEEFVALSKVGPLSPGPRRNSWTSQKSGATNKSTRDTRTFEDMGLGQPAIKIPRIFTQPASANGTPLQQTFTSDSSYDGKLDGKAAKEFEINEKVPPKAAQERFCFFSSEDPGTTHATELGGLLSGETTFRDMFEIGPEGGVWWLDVMNPTADELGAISRAFRIHPLTNEDILTQESREKVELFAQYYFVCFRTFYQMDKNSEDFLEPVNVYIVVFREGVISFSFSEHPHAVNVRKRIAKLRDYVALGSDWICYALM